MNPISIKFQVNTQCKDKDGNIGCFLTWLEPTPNKGIQFGETYTDLEGLFNSYEYKCAKRDKAIN